MPDGSPASGAAIAATAVGSELGTQVASAGTEKGSVPRTLAQSVTDHAKWASLAASIIALMLSAYSFYRQSLYEVHDFRAIDFGKGILLINAGNRTETLAAARYLYSDADWRPGEGGQLGKPTGPMVLKPGDAQVIHLLPIPPDRLDPPFRRSRHVSIDFLIVDTRGGYTSNRVFLETVLGVNVIHDQSEGPGPAAPGLEVTESAAPGRFDTAPYAQLYRGERTE